MQGKALPSSAPRYLHPDKPQFEKIASIQHLQIKAKESGVKMKRLYDCDASQHGIHTIHHEMDNGEKRFRLVSEHGSSYILTQGNVNSCWQKSHVHDHKREYYIVERGYVLLARMIDGKVKIDKFCENDSFSVSPGIAHNVWMSDNAILHTVKFGAKEDDWNNCEELDALLSEVDIQRFL
ncbi:MAG: hypothetical protein IJW90_07470 [Clostridia bacterium]|nr:hypothetical protein [Clostridia bacterium]